MNQAVREKEVAQWVEEAALLWLRREHLLSEPHLHLPELQTRDHRLQVRLDALLANEQIGWRMCERELGWEEPGELFPATILAVASKNPQHMTRVLDYALRSYELSRPVVSALTWSPLESVIDWLEDWFTSRDAMLRHLALAAALGHRQVPVSALTHAIRAENATLCARGVRGVGEIGYPELLPHVSELIGDLREEVAFEAAWTCALRMRQGQAVEKLWQVVRTGGRQAFRAVAVAARVSEVGTSLGRLQQIADRESGRRVALCGAAALGSPALIDWLLSWLEFPATARLAGEAISTITGLDLRSKDFFDLSGPSNTVRNASDMLGDGMIEFDPDEHVPWPVAAKIVEWWQQHRCDFSFDRRYVRGFAVSPSSCRRVLREGRQRERLYSALELAAGETSEPLFEVRAKAERQIMELDRVVHSPSTPRQDGNRS